MRIAASTIALGILLSATPAVAQDPTPLSELARRAQLAREIETILTAADRAHSAGQCQTRDALLLTLKSTIESQRAATMPDAAKDEWRQRGQEILNRRCPSPGRAPTPAAAPEGAAPGDSVMDAMGETAPNRSSLDVLTERMEAQIAACDDLKAFGDTKRDLLAEIERRMGIEKDPSKLIELRELYRRYATRLPPTCTPRRDPQPASAPDAPDKTPPVKMPREVKVRLFFDMLFRSRFLPLGGARVRPKDAPAETPGGPSESPPPSPLDPPRY